MLIPFDAIRSKEGAAYLAGAAVVLAITLGIFTDTVSDVLTQSKHTEALRLFLADDREARAKLLELLEANPHDVSALLTAAAYELDRADLDEQRLDAADRYYSQVRQVDPVNTAAIMGQSIILLRRAEGRSDLQSRSSAVDEARQLLSGVMNARHPDVVYLQGAMDLMRADVQAALEQLDDESLGLPSRAGAAARHWNRGAAAIMTNDARALERFLPAYTMRRWRLPNLGDPEKKALAGRYEAAAMLTLAYRVSMDTRNAEDLAERCDMALLAIGPHHNNSINVGPWLPNVEDTGIVENAVGMALVRAGRFDEGIQRIRQARKLNPEETLYQRNLGQAHYLLAQTIQDESKRAEVLVKSANAFRGLAEGLKGEEGQKDQRVLAITNAAALLVEAKNFRTILQSFRASEPAFSDKAQFHRDMGALLDQSQDKACVVEYREAIRQGHPEAREMTRRIRRYER